MEIWLSGLLVAIVLLIVFMANPFKGLRERKGYYGGGGGGGGGNAHNRSASSCCSDKCSG